MADMTSLRTPPLCAPDPDPPTAASRLRPRPVELFSDPVS